MMVAGQTGFGTHPCKRHFMVLSHSLSPSPSLTENQPDHLLMVTDFITCLCHCQRDVRGGMSLRCSPGHAVLGPCFELDILLPFPSPLMCFPSLQPACPTHTLSPQALVSFFLFLSIVGRYHLRPADGCLLRDG